METSSRRTWLKSMVALSAGLPLSSALAETLMTSPVSEAERSFFGSGKYLKLNSNENPYGPSTTARQAIQAVKGIVIPLRKSRP